MTHFAGDTDASAWRLLRAPLLTMAVLWTLVPALIHTSPPLDVVESAVWGREWVIATYKHPAMPAWVLELSRSVSGGRIGWSAYAVSQIFNLATLALTYLLARDLAGARVATAAVLTLLSVEYFSWRSIEFNHTLAQMPFWIGAVWSAWRAVQNRATGWWLALGAVAAFGLYAKLSNAMLLLVIAGWIVTTPRGRATLTSPGPYLGALVFAVMSVPLLRWLMATGYMPLEYASARGRDQSLFATLLFPVNAILQAVPILFTLGLAITLAKSSADVRPLAIATAIRSPASTPQSRHFLLLMAAAPALLSIVFALIGKSGLRAAWLAPSLPLFAVWITAQLATRLHDRVLQRASDVGLALAIILPLAYAAAIPTINRYTSAPLLRVNWPEAAIARDVLQAWKAATDKPLRIVVGSTWAAGLVALNHPDRPSIFTDGIQPYAPWISPERLQREGALVVWIEGRTSGETPVLDALIGTRPVQSIPIALTRAKRTHPTVLKYVVLPPQ